MVSFAYARIIPYVAVLLAYFVGLVVAVILLVRAKSTPAILATISFALLVLISIGQIILSLPPVSAQFFQAGPWLVWLSNCCCGLFDLVAIICLIVTIWQAVSGTIAEEAVPEATYDTETWDVVEEMPEEIVKTSEQASEEANQSTVKLETEPTDTSYATRVLRETQEEGAESSEEETEENA